MATRWSVSYPDCDWRGWSSDGVRSRRRCNVWIILNLFKGVNYICAVFQYQLRTKQCDVKWWCVIETSLFFRIGCILMLSALNTWKNINHVCASASRQFWQSHSLIFAICFMLHFQFYQKWKLHHGPRYSDRCFDDPCAVMSSNCCKGISIEAFLSIVTKSMRFSNEY